jgi:hypothetical protein
MTVAPIPHTLCTTVSGPTTTLSDQRLRRCFLRGLRLGTPEVALLAKDGIGLLRDLLLQHQDGIGVFLLHSFHLRCQALDRRLGEVMHRIDDDLSVRMTGDY